MASLKSFVAELNAAQKDIVPPSKLGDRTAGLKGTLNASLQDDLSAKLIITDKTVSSVRAARAGARARAARAARARAAAGMPAGH